MRRADIDCAAVVPGLGQQVAAAVGGGARGVEGAQATDEAAAPAKRPLEVEVEGTTRRQRAGRQTHCRAAGTRQERVRRIEGLRTAAKHQRSRTREIDAAVVAARSIEIERRARTDVVSARVGAAVGVHHQRAVGDVDGA